MTAINMNLNSKYDIVKFMIKGSKQKSIPAPLSSFKVDFDREEDGRWIAEIPKLKGVMAYGTTKREALQRVYAIALRTLADSVEEGNLFTPISRLFGYGVARN
jgi:predicted RNase H-like HicB family nuclease